MVIQKSVSDAHRIQDKKTQKKLRTKNIENDPK
jgi:hypothetical protein